MDSFTQSLRLCMDKGLVSLVQKTPEREAAERDDRERRQYSRGSYSNPYAA